MYLVKYIGGKPHPDVTTTLFTTYTESDAYWYVRNMNSALDIIGSYYGLVYDSDVIGEIDMVSDLKNNTSVFKTLRYDDELLSELIKIYKYSSHYVIFQYEEVEVRHFHYGTASESDFA